MPPVSSGNVATLASRPWVLPDSVAARLGNVATAPDSTGNVATESDPQQAGNVATLLPSFVPTTTAEMAQCLADAQWRVGSGMLYKIMVKSLQGDESVIPFLPNAAQRRLMAKLWHRNLILKARQLGMTTLVCILWLDHALFNSDQRCGIIAQDREAAESIFRDKVKLAYERLPEALRSIMPLKRDSASELLFAHNNSSIKVATSMRSGTIHRLHVSEFGKICAKFPDKATEVVTGSLPAVPIDGIAVIESTAEGQEGEFYKMTQRATAQAQRSVALTPKDFRIHFYAWWQEPGYRLAGPVEMTGKDHEYFAQVETATGTTLDEQQRNWYVATRESDFSGDPEKMWQEMPSTATEAFQVSTEGCYYAVQLATARKEGRICHVPHVVGTPVSTFWDIGAGDGTAIWFHQRVGFENRFLDFEEAWGESYSFFIQKMQAKGYVWGTHYLPHDAGHKRQQGNKVASPEDELRAFAIGGSWEVLPAVDEVIHGIQKTRDVFGTCFFDAAKTALGIAHLSNYRKTWNRARGGWNVNQPSKIEGHSEAADALRQFGQGYIAPRLIETPARRGNWRAV